MLARPRYAVVENAHVEIFDIRMKNHAHRIKESLRVFASAGLPMAVATSIAEFGRDVARNR